MHNDWDAVQESVKRVGERIATDGLPSEPLVFCFTGKGGNVHTGAMEVFSLLPHEMISIEDLPSIRNRPGPQKCVYGLSLATKDLVRQKGGLPFDREHYQQNPQEYEPIFQEKIAPYVSVIVNGMYWDERFPRLLTKDQMQKLYTDGHKEYVLAVASSW
jgi:alpha-aminoadipic semialdehyde synthase